MNNFYELLGSALADREINTLEEPVNWDEIISKAKLFSLSQIIVKGIRCAGLNNYPVNKYGELEKSALDDEYEQLRIEGQSRFIIKELNKENIRFAVSDDFIAKLGYPSSQMRHMKELTLIVENPNALDSVLTGIGYEIKQSFIDKKYYMINDGVTVDAVMQATAPEGEFSDIYDYSRVINISDCVFAGDDNINYYLPKNEAILEYLIKRAAQAFICGGLTPLEVFDIILFADKFTVNKNILINSLSDSALVYFASAIFALAAKYYKSKFSDYLIYTKAIDDELIEELCFDTLQANIDWDIWSTKRLISLPRKLKQQSTVSRFFDVIKNKNVLSQQLNLSSERSELLKAVGLV